MRLSINLDDELYAVAKSLAKAEGCSLSAAVNLLLRRAIQSPGRAEGAKRAEPLSSFPTSAGARLITEEDVKSLDDLP
jgi:Arc/MetJ family transcription regulator